MNSNPKDNFWEKPNNKEWEDNNINNIKTTINEGNNSVNSNKNEILDGDINFSEKILEKEIIQKASINNELVDLNIKDSLNQENKNNLKNKDNSKDMILDVNDNNENIIKDEINSSKEFIDVLVNKDINEKDKIKEDLVEENLGKKEDEKLVIKDIEIVNDEKIEEILQENIVKKDIVQEKIVQENIQEEKIQKEIVQEVKIQKEIVQDDIVQEKVQKIEEKVEDSKNMINILNVENKKINEKLKNEKIEEKNIIIAENQAKNNILQSKDTINNNQENLNTNINISNNININDNLEKNYGFVKIENKNNMSNNEKDEINKSKENLNDNLDKNANNIKPNPEDNQNNGENQWETKKILTFEEKLELELKKHGMQGEANDIEETIESNFLSSDWKKKVEAYQKGIDLIKAKNLKELGFIQKKLHLIIKDKNPKSLEKLIEFLDYYLKEVKELNNIDNTKTFMFLYDSLIPNFKPAFKENGLKLFPLFYKKYNKNAFKDLLKDKLGASSIKIQENCLVIFFELVKEFGINEFDMMKPYLPLLEKGIKSKKASVKFITHEIYKECIRWMPNFTVFLSEEVPVKKELIEFSKNLDKTQLKKNNNNGGDDEVDAFEFLDEVDSLKIYNDNWVSNLIQLKAWKEKLKKLEDFLNYLEANPKIKSSSFSHILNMFNKLLWEQNINIQIVTIKIMDKIAFGLRKKFSNGAKTLFPKVLLKLKDRKQKIIELVYKVIDSFYYCMSFEDMMDDILDCFKDKNKNIDMKLNIIKLIMDYLKKNKKHLFVIQNLNKVFLKFLDDGDKNLREKTFEIYGNIFTEIGEEKISKYLKDINSNKLAKIKTYIIKEEIIENIEESLAEEEFDIVSENDNNNDKPAEEAQNKSTKYTGEFIEFEKIDLIEEEEIINILKPLIDSDEEDILDNLKNGVWKKKMNSIKFLKEVFIQNDNSKNLINPIFEIIYLNTNCFKDSNLMLNKTIFNIVNCLLENITDDYSTILFIVKYCVVLINEKISEQKYLNELTEISKIIVTNFYPNYFFQYLLELVTKKVINPKLAKEFGKYLRSMEEICTFNVMDLNLLANYFKNYLLNSNSGIRNEGITMFKLLYKYKGADLIKLIEDINSKTLGQLKSDFESIQVYKPNEAQPSIELKKKLVKKPKTNIVEIKVKKEDKKKIEKTKSKVIKDKKNITKKNIPNKEESTKNIKKINFSLEIEDRIPKLLSKDKQEKINSLNEIKDLIIQSNYKVNIDNFNTFLNNLKIRLEEKNKQVLISSIDLFEIVIKKLDTKFSKYSSFILPSLINNFSDKNTIIKDKLVNCLNTIKNISEFTILGNLLIKNLAVENPEIRKEIWTYLLDNQNLLDKPDYFKGNQKVLITIMGDKNKEVKKLSEKLLEISIKILGDKDFIKIANNTDHNKTFTNEMLGIIKKLKGENSSLLEKSTNKEPKEKISNVKKLENSKKYMSQINVTDKSINDAGSKKLEQIKNMKWDYNYIKDLNKKKLKYQLKEKFSFLNMNFFSIEKENISALFEKINKNISLYKDNKILILRLILIRSYENFGFLQNLILEFLIKVLKLNLSYSNEEKIIILSTLFNLFNCSNDTSNINTYKDIVLKTFKIIDEISLIDILNKKSINNYNKNCLIFILSLLKKNRSDIYNELPNNLKTLYISSNNISNNKSVSLEKESFNISQNINSEKKEFSDILVEKNDESEIDNNYFTKKKSQIETIIDNSLESLLTFRLEQFEDGVKNLDDLMNNSNEDISDEFFTYSNRIIKTFIQIIDKIFDNGINIDLSETEYDMIFQPIEVFINTENFIENLNFVEIRDLIETFIKIIINLNEEKNEDNNIDEDIKELVIYCISNLTNFILKFIEMIDINCLYSIILDILIKVENSIHNKNYKVICAKLIIKLNNRIEQNTNTIDIDKIFLKCHEYLIIYKSKSKDKDSNNLGLKIIKTLINELITKLGHNKVIKSYRIIETHDTEDYYIKDIIKCSTNFNSSNSKSNNNKVNNNENSLKKSLELILSKYTEENIKLFKKYNNMLNKTIQGNNEKVDVSQSFYSLKKSFQEFILSKVPSFKYYITPKDNNKNTTTNSLSDTFKDWKQRMNQIFKK